MINFCASLRHQPLGWERWNRLAQFRESLLADVGRPIAREGEIHRRVFDRPRFPSMAPQPIDADVAGDAVEIGTEAGLLFPHRLEWDGTVKGV